MGQLYQNEIEAKHNGSTGRIRTLNNYLLRPTNGDCKPYYL